MRSQVGVDIVWIPDFKRKIIENPALLDHLFTKLETQDCTKLNSELSYGSLAARFSVKESVLKTMEIGLDDLGGINLKSIEVRKKNGGAPYIHLADDIATFAQEMGVFDWSVSISHSNEYAISSVVGNF